MRNSPICSRVNKFSERRQPSTYTQVLPVNNPQPQIIMSTVVEKVSDAINNVTAALGNTSISDKPADSANAEKNDAVLASAAEGRRLYIGNLAYATTEGELTTFFKGYLV